MKYLHIVGLWLLFVGALSAQIIGPGGGSGSPGGGEANTYTSSGSGTAIIGVKSGVNLPHKSLVCGTGCTSFASSATEVTLNVEWDESGTNTPTGTFDISGGVFIGPGGSGVPTAGLCTASTVAATKVDTDNGGVPYTCLQTGAGTYTWVAGGADTNLTQEEVEDIAGPLVATGGTKTRITVTYQDATGDMDFEVDAETNSLETLVTGIASGEILIGNGTDSGVYVAPSGDWTITTGGVATLATGLKDYVVIIPIFSDATTVTTGDGKGTKFYIPSEINGWDLIDVDGWTNTAGVTGTQTLDIARCAVAATGNTCVTVVDVLSTNLTWDTNETNTSTAATPAVIDTAQDDVATNQAYRFDIDGVHTTPATGTTIRLTFREP